MTGVAWTLRRRMARPWARVEYTRAHPPTTWPICTPVHVVSPDEVFLQEAGRIGHPEIDARCGGFRHHLRATRHLERQRLFDHDRPSRCAGGHHRIDVGVLGERHDHRVDAGVVDQCSEIVAIGIRLSGLGQTLCRLERDVHDPEVLHPGMGCGQPGAVGAHPPGADHSETDAAMTAHH